MSDALPPCYRTAIVAPQRQAGGSLIACSLLLLLALRLPALAGETPPPAAMPPGRQIVATYHYDNNRSGWNHNETVLTPARVAGPGFGLQHVVALDDQVDAQPLVMPGLSAVGGHATRGDDVVYVVTEGNTVYAIDAASGAPLAGRNLGPPVPLPLSCNNNGPNVGINSTPVIDAGARTMYVIAYVLEAGGPVYHLHALDIATLADRVPPVTVAASHPLSNGKTTAFDPRHQRQRAGLLAANSNIYAGFASFCDFQANLSRGWILGWRQDTLAPLPANELVNQLSTAPEHFFLSSVWMSGYGLAADSDGFIYAATGNSDFSGTTYQSNNLSDTVIRLAPDLSRVVDLFTPANVDALDRHDLDLGSGGVLVVPVPGGSALLAAAGKDGRMFILDADDMGGFTSGGPDRDVFTQKIGNCWCGPSYFVRSGGGGVPGGVIVASGGNAVTLWAISTSPRLALSSAGSSQPLSGGGQDPGFFTTVSSAGVGAGVVIWAVSRPASVADPAQFLYAFSPALDATGHLVLLNRLPAGSWPSLGGNANTVPVVANGRVFVASYRQLSIFGRR